MINRRRFLVAMSVLCAAAWPSHQATFAKPAPQSSSASASRQAPAAKAPDIVFEQLDTKARFEPDGTGEFETAVRLRVMTESAVQQLAQVSYAYNASFGTARFEHLEVRKPSGQVNRAAADAIKDTSIQALPNVMTDLHQLQAAVPGLARGGESTAGRDRTPRRSRSPRCSSAPGTAGSTRRTSS